MRRHKDPSGEEGVKFEPEQKIEYDIAEAIPFEVKRGSILLLHGDLIHFSKANLSNKSRHAYIIHFVESRDCLWEADNWLQRKHIPFRYMNDIDSGI